MKISKKSWHYGLRTMFGAFDIICFCPAGGQPAWIYWAMVLTFPLWWALFLLCVAIAAVLLPLVFVVDGARRVYFRTGLDKEIEVREDA